MILKIFGYLKLKIFIFSQLPRLNATWSATSPSASARQATPETHSSTASRSQFLSPLSSASLHPAALTPLAASTMERRFASACLVTSATRPTAGPSASWTASAPAQKSVDLSKSVLTPAETCAESTLSARPGTILCSALASLDTPETPLLSVRPSSLQLRTRKSASADTTPTVNTDLALLASAFRTTREIPTLSVALSASPTATAPQ